MLLLRIADSTMRTVSENYLGKSFVRARCLAKSDSYLFIGNTEQSTAAASSELLVTG